MLCLLRFAVAVDYFQIVSVFGSLQMQWPGPILTMFKTASASTSNTEVASPECSVSISYTDKWYFLQVGVALFLPWPNSHRRYETLYYDNCS